MAGFLLIFLTLGLMWLLLIRPQQRRLREHQELVRGLEVGQEVITGSGVYGTIIELDDETAMLQIAPGVTIKVVRDAIGALASVYEAERPADPILGSGAVDEAGPTGAHPPDEEREA